MKTIYSVLISDSAGGRLQHTMLFDNPPTHTDISDCLIRFIDPSIRSVDKWVVNRVTVWAKEISDRRISYYPSDLKYQDASWRFQPEKKDIDPDYAIFSLTISHVELNECIPEKKEEKSITVNELFALVNTDNAKKLKGPK